MNYRHAYHAGNVADVHKHAVLAQVVTALTRKETPFFALDTHAGCGGYLLTADAAQRTGEFKAGIARVLDQEATAPAALAPYLETVRRFNPDGGLTRYPGSPELIRTLMRPQDRLALAELHPEDVQTLRRTCGADRRIGIHHMDGYLAVKALLPPQERRGLVLIDPPFEQTDEFSRLLTALGRLRRRWPQGILLLWYPIKGAAPVEQFLAAITAEGGNETLAVELLLRPPVDPFRLNGSGLIVVNPPWGLEAALAETLPWLAGVLAPEQGAHRVRRLIAEQSGTA